MPKQISVMILAALIIFVFAACGQTTGSPTHVPTFEPVSAVDSQEFTLSWMCLAETKESPRVQKALVYLEKLLKDKGWNVKIAMTVAAKDLDDMNWDVAKALDKDIAAGFFADGYIVSQRYATTLLKDGLVHDLSALLLKHAPALYEQFKDRLGDRIAGVPLNLDVPKDRHTALIIQKEILTDSQRISDRISELVSMLENNKEIRLAIRGDDFRSGLLPNLLAYWAGEQGYYPLDQYCINGGFYAAMNDDQYKIVPVEDIPGFDVFFSRCLKLINGNRFIAFYDMESSFEDNVVGIIEPLESSMEQSNMQYHMNLMESHTRSGGDYIAIPLLGCSLPAYGQTKEYSGMMIAVPSASQKAAQAIRFANWALMDREGYDLIAYGKEGTDYRLAGGRMEFLFNGKELSPGVWSVNPEYNPTPYFMNNIFGFLFINTAMQQVPVYAPENYETAASAIPPMTHPIRAVEQLRQPYMLFSPLFEELNTKYEATINDRSLYLQGSIKAEGGEMPGTAAECIAALRAMVKDTLKCVAAYQLRLKQLSEE